MTRQSSNPLSEGEKKKLEELDLKLKFCEAFTGDSSGLQSLSSLSIQVLELFSSLNAREGHMLKKSLMSVAVALAYKSLDSSKSTSYE